MANGPASFESLQEQLDDLQELTEENNRLLKAMRRDAIIGGILKMVIWLVLIVASFYLSAKFLEPYLGALQGGDGTGQADYQALFDQYKGLIGQ